MKVGLTMDFEIGQVVFSKRGRDKGRALIVFQTDGEWLWLVDGKTRKTERPKKKKAMHVQPVKHIDAALKEKISGGKVNDADVRKALAEFARGGEVEHV